MNREVVSVVVGFLVGIGVAGGGWFLMSSFQPEASSGRGGAVVDGATGGVAGGPGRGAAASPLQGALEERLAVLEQENRALRTRLAAGGQDVEPVQPDENDRVPGEITPRGENETARSIEMPPPPPGLANLQETFDFLTGVAAEADAAGMDYAAARLKNLLSTDAGALSQVVEAFRRAQNEYEVAILGQVLADFAMNTYEDNDLFEAQLVDMVASEPLVAKRRWAVEALTFLDVDDQALQRLGTQTMSEREPRLRAELAGYLAAKSAVGRTVARQVLVRLARTDESEEVRVAAVAGLSTPDPEGARVLLEAVQADASAIVRSQAARALWLGGSEPTSDTLSGLEAVARGERSRDAAFEVVSALAVLGREQALPGLGRIAGAGGDAAPLAAEYLRAIQERENLDPDAIMNRIRAKLGPEPVREGE